MVALPAQMICAPGKCAPRPANRSVPFVKSLTQLCRNAGESARRVPSFSVLRVRGCKVQHELLAKAFLLALARVAERVGEHAAARFQVILLAMQVAVQPELRLRHQV